MKSVVRGVIAFLVCLLLPRDASAIQLRWSSGSSELDFTATTRCTLVVQAADAEQHLPKDWRLLCVADTSGIEPIPMPAPDSCGLGIAELASLIHPTNNLDVLANQLTAHFCSLGSGRVYLARYYLDLPAGSHGKFQVVAIDPTDANARRVIESPEVVFNGGCAASFPPQILRTETQHQSTEFDLRVIGSGLEAVQQAWLVAPDGSWEEQLTLTSLSDTLLQATASLASSVPDCWVRLNAYSGAVAASMLLADPPPPPLGPQAACQARFIEDIYPAAVIQPKDFAFVPGGWSATGSWVFHLFYIRQNQLTKTNPSFGAGFTEKNLGHAVSNDLAAWTVLDTAAIQVRAGRWDSQHVWAPAIVRRGVKYYMFYTGVDGANNQRVGIATSTDLIHWAQGDSVLHAINAGNWVDLDNFKDLRDPFVMEDPNAPGQWLMYYTARAKIMTVKDAQGAVTSSGMVTGYARSTGDFLSWAAGAPFFATQQNRQSGLESPHVFQRAGKWWIFFTKPRGDQDTIYALSTFTSPTDTLLSNWSQPKKIGEIVPLNEATAYTFWHGSEYLKLAGSGAGKEYLAGFNDSDQSISYTQMRDVASPYLFAGDCPDALGVDDHPEKPLQPGLKLLSYGPGRGRIDLELTLSNQEDVTVAVYDIVGRKLKTIAKGRLPQGRTRLSWDATDTNGGRVASGVYFATPVFSEGRRSTRVAFIR